MADINPDRFRLRGGTMKAIADLCVIPIGVGVKLGTYIAACEKILAKAGLKTRLHGCGTNIEGEWDTVMQAIKECHAALHEMGVPRVSTTIHIGTRVDRDQTIEDKIQSVVEKV
jgi:uncharacterized protein (TIGR00106 family)